MAYYPKDAAVMENLRTRIASLGVPLMRMREFIQLAGAISVQVEDGKQGRDVAMYLCREVGQRSLRDIAEWFGAKYPAVSLACKRVREMASAGKQFKKKLKESQKSIINRWKT
jgi:hypothetical protein